MIPLYIPSRGRHGRVNVGPAAQLPIDVRSWATYFVPESEEALYRKALDAAGLTVVGVVPVPDATRIAAKRETIGNHAWARGHGKFVMMDDDLGILVRKSSDAWNLRPADGADVMFLMTWIQGALEKHAHVGVSAREGNNHIGVGDLQTLVQENTRTMRVLAYRTEDFLSVEHCRVEVMEDFDVALQLLRQGKSNAVTYWWAQGQQWTNAPGGCATWRTHEIHEASARRLADLHPGLVRLRQKTNKTDAEGFGTRLECTISWKKAYEQGKKLAG